WILTSGGIVIYDRVLDNQVFDAKLKTQLFGALMSALNALAEQLAEGGLTNFEMNTKRFVIKKRNDFLFIACDSKTVKEKRIVYQLNLITESFFEKFGDISVNWDKDLNVYSDFEPEF
ncbi:MAG: hypothetical protein KGD61_11425, partial [Candidatus Lokiarchaeota archaeon]|nr:hypothetical protein [Candidatus Lokiarchaeota archaeon]